MYRSCCSEGDGEEADASFSDTMFMYYTFRNLLKFWTNFRFLQNIDYFDSFIKSSEFVKKKRFCLLGYVVEKSPHSISLSNHTKPQYQFLVERRCHHSGDARTNYEGS